MNKLRLPFALVFALGLPLLAQEPFQEIASAATASAAPQFTPEQLDELLGPIALYPDALVALILPATTVPADIVLAARYLKDSDGQLSQVESRAWDDSVKALTHYPDVLKWMDENLTWTKQVGEAFAAQPADVMNAVQRLRAKARAAGTLVDTSQQQIVVDNSAISIVPTQPDVIYVPYYNPDVVYVSRPSFYSDPFITFGPAYTAGFWLSYNMDWSHRRVWCVNRSDRERFWRDHNDFWRRPTFTSRPGYVGTPVHRPWVPQQDSWRQSRPTTTVARVQPQVVRPAPYTNTPRTYAGARPNTTDYHRNFGGSHTVENSAAPQPTSPRGRSFASGTRSSTPNPAPTPQLQLANPVPQPLPSPLPEIRSPATPPTTNRGMSYDRRGEGSHNFRGVSPAPQPQTTPAVVQRYNAPADAIPPARFSHSAPQQHVGRPAPVAPAPQTAPAPVSPPQQVPPAPAPNSSPSQPATNNGDRTQGHRRYQY